jgi:hypothetical protein
MYAIDCSPDQRRSPLIDHADVIAVMSGQLRVRVVACVNEGRQRRL